MIGGVITVAVKGQNVHTVCLLHMLVVRSAACANLAYTEQVQTMS